MIREAMSRSWAKYISLSSMNCDHASWNAMESREAPWGRRPPTPDSPDSFFAHDALDAVLRHSGWLSSISTLIDLSIIISALSSSSSQGYSVFVVVALSGQMCQTWACNACQSRLVPWPNDEMGRLEQGSDVGWAECVGVPMSYFSQRTPI